MMKSIDVFDPPMCCSTGVCGTDVDVQLTQFAADLNWLSQQGYVVRRYNLAQEPQAFVADSQVQSLLHETDGQALPIIVIDGRVVSQSLYPSREQFLTLLQPASERSPVKLMLANETQQDRGCCGSGDCC